MAESRFGYANVNVNKFSNEQNIRSLKSFADSLSDSVSFYIQGLEDEIENMRKELDEMKKGQ